MATVTKRYTPPKRWIKKPILEGDIVVFKGDKPTLNSSAVYGLSMVLSECLSYMEYYKLKYESFVTLIVITAKWVNTGKGSTACSLCKGDHKATTAVLVKCGKLLDKGLLTVVGTGKYGCRVYGPTDLVFKAFGSYLKETG